MLENVERFRNKSYKQLQIIFFDLTPNFVYLLSLLTVPLVRKSTKFHKNVSLLRNSTISQKKYANSNKYTKNKINEDPLAFESICAPHHLPSYFDWTLCVFLLSLLLPHVSHFIVAKNCWKFLMIYIRVLN